MYSAVFQKKGFQAFFYCEFIAAVNLIDVTVVLYSYCLFNRTDLVFTSSAETYGIIHTYGHI